MSDSKKPVLTKEQVDALFGCLSDSDTNDSSSEELSFKVLRPKYNTLVGHELDRLLSLCKEREVNYDRIFEIATDIKLEKGEGQIGLDLKANILSNLILKRDMLLLSKKNGLASDLITCEFLASVDAKDFESELLNLRLYILEMQ